MKIKATLHAMAETEILSMISHGEFLRIKQEDPKPLFRAYVVGHEGEFKPTAVGIGKIVTQWFDSAIRKLRDQISHGTKLFLGHAETNVHDNRESIGEIVGTALKTIKDRLSVVAVAYIKPGFRDLRLDIASIEADVELNIDEEKGVYEAEVKDITGIALGDSRKETPAFTGATLIGEMQAFLNQSHQYKGGGDMGLTASEIREFIRTEKLKPSDLFGLEDLTGDPLITKHIEAEAKEKKSGDWYHRQRDADKHTKEVTDLTEAHKKEKDDLTKERDEARKLVLKGQIPALVTTIKEERKLDESQESFIDRTLSRFSPGEKSEDLEKDLNSFFDGQIKEHKELGEAVYGVKEKDPDPEKKGDKGNDKLSPQMEEMALE